ncbi:MAG: tetratricopeptide repeat protein [Desulfobacterium sp.]|nr:tetratricopeptide repeat protein [Desulfobacterium sp.]
MTELRFQFFGPPCFTLNGASIKVGRRKALALAAYLAVTGKSHSRERLADLFWPEVDRERARSSLRRTLSVMTKALGKFWLAIDRDTIGFVPHGDLWVDVIRFRELTARASSGAESVAALEEAALIYDGFFLAGFSLGDAPDFDDWQFEQAEGLCLRAISVMAGVTEGSMARGEYPRAIGHAQNWAELDPLNEEAHRQLIRLYCQTGEQGFALRQYEKCKDLLEKELGVLPDKATSALAATIRTKPFAPEKPFSLPLTNLPAQSTRFVGRKQEIKALVGRMADPGVRLLTLTGPGGIGKTRLALEAAIVMEAAPALEAASVMEAASALGDGFPQGVFFLSLGDLSSVEAVVSALVRTFGLSFDEMSDPLSQLLDFLGPRNPLVVLDNLEHLPEAGMLVLKMLNRSPGLKILATSRTRLMLKGEHLFPLSGLLCPGLALQAMDKHAISKVEERYDAVALFFSTARMVRPDMELNAANVNGVIRICELTQGMPLALILAAGWAEIFPPEEIADEIRKSLDFLKAEIRDLPPSHQSMRAVFDSSWNRLPENEKEIFMKLSVFRDCFTLDAVAAVTSIGRNVAAAIAASLVRKSMLKADPGTGRFEIHPLLRQYVREELAKLNLEKGMMDAHEHYYLNQVNENGKQLIGEGMLACRESMDADFANIRQAWFWAVGERDLASLTCAATGLYVYFDMHTRYHEGEAMFRPAKELVQGALGENPDLGVILVCWFDMHDQGFSPQDPSLCSLEAFQEITGVAHAWLRKAVNRGDGKARAFALLLMGAIAYKQERYQRAIRLFRLSLEADPGIEHSFWVTIRIALCRRALGQMDRAIQGFRQSHGVGSKLGDAIKCAWSLGNIGSAELCMGNLEKAESCLRSAGASFGRINAPMGMVSCWEELGLIAFLKGDLTQAALLADQALGTSKDLGFALSRYQRAQALKGLVLVAAGDPCLGKTCLGKVLKTGMSRFTAHLGMTFFACLEEDLSAGEFHLKAATGSASSVHKPQLKVLLLLASAAVAAQAGEDVAACGLLSLVFHHPSCPTALFRVWAFPCTLVARIKSRMTPGEFDTAWNQGKNDGTPWLGIS